MSSDDHDMLNRISQLAGQINRHKNHSGHASSPGLNLTDLQTHTTGNGELPRGRGRGRGRGRNGAFASTYHRNKTLVLNGAVGTTEVQRFDALEPSSAAPAPPSWISKNDRHRQLINPTVFEKHSAERTKAIEKTRTIKLKQRDEREKSKITNFLQRATTPLWTAEPGIQHAHSRNTQEIIIQGLRFRVDNGGSKLTRLRDSENISSSRPSPKIATVGGVRFHRSKTGNLYRSGIVREQRRNGNVTKVKELCKTFTTTGSCPKGPRCRYTHDPTKVAICKEFLQKGECPSGDFCDLSHDLTPERTPTCLHFARGNCAHANCRYAHIRVSPAALVCRDFGVYGYCGEGSECSQRHVHECPDFSNTGVCHTRGCKLPHRDKASNIRKLAVQEAKQENESDSDLSSDQELYDADEGDVDSDNLENLFDDTSLVDPHIRSQEDFVQF